MVVDKDLARIILDKCCLGLSFDKSSRRYVLNIVHVSTTLFNHLQSEALLVGLKLRAKDLNDFLLNIENDNSFTIINYNFSFRDKDILIGEIIRLNIDNNTNQVELLKMTDNEYLVLDSFTEKNRAQYIRTEPETIFRKGSAFQYDLLSSQCKISRIDFIIPSNYHRILDQLWMPDLARNTVTDNLWPLYNEVKERIENSYLCADFQYMLQEFSQAGMSSFIFRKIINAIMNYWYE